jgi:Outer membrane protein beta-barrel domain
MKRTSLALISLFVPALAVAQPPPPPPGPGYYGPSAGQEAPNFRQGLTFEANLGIGFMWVDNGTDESDKKVALGGLNLGIGGWLNPKMALSLRVAGTTYTDSEGGIDFRFTTGVLGPHLQYWIDDHIWLGGGAGIGVAAVNASGNGVDESESETGFGLDLRAGYTFSTSSENTFNISFELTPSFITIDERDYTFYSSAILFGYQHL